MSETLLMLIISICPSPDVDHKGQLITNKCHESIVNCIYRGANETPSKKTIGKCASEFRSNEYRSSTEDVSDTY